MNFSDKNLLRKYLNIDIISSTFINKKSLDKYYKKQLKHENKRTRSDSKILPFQMIIMLIIWITNVDDGIFFINSKTSDFA